VNRTYPQERKWGIGICIGLMGAITCNLLHAEMSGDAYQSIDRPLSAIEAQRAAQDVEAQRQKAHRAAIEQEAAENQERLAHQQRLAQRPIGQQILEARCTACHGLNVLEAHTGSLIFWYWTVGRMKWIYGADLGWNDLQAIARYLAQERP